MPLILLALPLLSVPGEAPRPPLPPQAQLAGEDAYRQQRAGDLPGALLAVDRALDWVPDHPEWRRLKLDLLAETGALEEADRLSLQLLADRPGDGSLTLQRAYLLQRMGREEEAVQVAHGLLEQGDLAREFELPARLVLADLLQALGRPGPALAALAPVAADPAPDIQSRRGFLLLADGEAAAARDAFALALQGDLQPARRQVLLRGHLEAARKAGAEAELVPDLKALQRLDPEDHALALELAYAHLAAGDDPAALAAFRSGLGTGAPPGAWIDGAYTAKRLGRNQEAAAWFVQGLEVQRTLPDYRAGTPAEFGLRREVETLNRTWGLALGSYYRQGGLLPGVFSTQKVLQQGVDLFWQPQALAANGRNVQVFAEVFENLWSADQATTGGPTVQWALGVRAKPFQEPNLVLGVEKLFRGGAQALDDWMLKAGYSFDRGVDLRPWDRRWGFWSVFTEGDSLPRKGRYLHTLEARWGESWRFESAPATAWTPHLVLAGDFDNRDPRETATGAGAGIQMRTWFRGGADTAPASWAEVSVQVRARLTDSNRQGGLFLRASLWF